MINKLIYAFLKACKHLQETLYLWQYEGNIIFIYRIITFKTIDFCFRLIEVIYCLKFMRPIGILAQQYYYIL
jgi:hypothetical protein